MGYDHIIDRKYVRWTTGTNQKLLICEISNEHLKSIIENCKNLYLDYFNNITDDKNVNDIILRLKGGLILDEDLIELLETELMYRINNNIVLVFNPDNRGYRL